MIEPTNADAGKRVRMHTHSRTMLGSLHHVDQSYVWVLFDGDPTPRAVIRCLLTWVRQ